MLNIGITGAPSVKKSDIPKSLIKKIVSGDNLKRRMCKFLN